MTVANGEMGGARTVPPAKAAPRESELVAVLSDLAEALAQCRFPLAVPDRSGAEELRERLREQTTDYLLPRARNLDAPLVVVVGGSTGAGKSTLVNSIVGDAVTEPGVLRPTTRWPVLLHHPDDRADFESDRILPDFDRVVRPETGPVGQSRQIRLVSSEAVPQGLAIIDSPDIDSISDENRALARQLLAAADLWLFVTSAARYADAVPWELLKLAGERGTTVAMVLDRVPPQAGRDVRQHLSDLLKRAGMASTPLFTIPELELDNGMLPESVVYPVRSWILNLGTNAAAKDLVIKRSLTGALAAVPGKVRELARSCTHQEEAHARLGAAVDEEYARAWHTLLQSLADGHVLRGDVLARWQDFVGTGQLFRGLEPTVARIRDRVTAAFGGKRDSAEPLGEAIEDSAAVLIREQIMEAVNATVTRWHAGPEGRELLRAGEGIGRVPDDLDRALKTLLREWGDDVNALVRDVGQSKRAKARILSFGVNGVGAILMLAVFDGTGGITGSEAGVAGGTALVAGKLLDTIFGDQVTRELAVTARQRLHSRAQALLSSTRAQFDTALAAAGPTEAHAESLRKHADLLEDAL